LPLPILYALKNPKKTERLLRLLRKRPIAEKEAKLMLDMVMDSEEARKLKKEMRSMVEEENQHLHLTKLYRNTFMLLLRSMVEDL
jgi:geranylgeranyl pyrophosphate synthase